MATHSDKVVSYSSNLGYSGLVTPGEDSGCSIALGYACSVSSGGLGCSVGAALVVSVPCSIDRDGFCCSGAVFVLKHLSNCSTSVVSLVPYSKKKVSWGMRSRVASVALYCDDRAGI